MKHKKMKMVATTALLGLASAPALLAQETNTGVQDIVTAINGLRPDITTIVTAGIGLGIIVLGAMIAWKVAKKFFG